nr:immunoglobulin heavy chain junction region [Macaca mulatta]MOV51423.1 immunoglobulin heavy chain junction region [Macaca mulatta]MOV53057.1 immunoglobulin heavy chain junction region [Macaca mulatta]
CARDASAYSYPFEYW